MHNLSPYDSGCDSSFSTAFGRSQPSSSQGNSDIDNQMDHYIVATFINTLTEPPNSPNPLLSQTSKNTTTTLPPDPFHLQAHCVIVEHHRTIQRPRIPDSETDEDNTDDRNIIPSLIRLGEDNLSHCRTTNQPACHSWMVNRTYNFCRQFRFGRNYPPTRATHEYLLIFDVVRTTTHDIPGCWPEHHSKSPPNSNSPPLAAITDEQFAYWIDSQLPWHEFYRSIPDYCPSPIPQLLIHARPPGLSSRTPRRINLPHLILLTNTTSPTTVQKGTSPQPYHHNPLQNPSD